MLLWHYGLNSSKPAHNLNNHSRYLPKDKQDLFSLVFLNVIWVLQSKGNWWSQSNCLSMREHHTQKCICKNQQESHRMEFPSWGFTFASWRKASLLLFCGKALLYLCSGSSLNHLFVRWWIQLTGNVHEWKGTTVDKTFPKGAKPWTSAILSLMQHW